MATVLDQLFDQKKKTWDFAIVYCVGRSPIAIEKTTKYRLENEILVIDDPEFNNPFRRSENEPATCILHAEIALECVSSVELITFNKIKTADSKIITMK